MLSKSIIFIKNKFKEQYDENKRELNILLTDELINRASVGFIYLEMFGIDFE